jgi:hypothetical protein
MATVDAIGRSPASLAASHVLDAEIDASVMGAPEFPEGTVFVPEELAGDERIREYHADGRPVAVVRDDGGVDLLRPSRVRPEAILIALIGAAVVIWILSRRAPSQSLTA